MCDLQGGLGALSFSLLSPGVSMGALHSAPKEGDLSVLQVETPDSPLHPASLLHAQLGLQAQAHLNEILALGSGLLSLCLIVGDTGVAIPVSQGCHTITKMNAGQATKMAGPVPFPTSPRP